MIMALGGGQPRPVDGEWNLSQAYRSIAVVEMNDTPGRCEFNQAGAGIHPRGER
jgi:hypothetical protein